MHGPQILAYSPGLGSKRHLPAISAEGHHSVVDGRVARQEGLEEEGKRLWRFWFWRERLVWMMKAFGRAVGDGKWKWKWKGKERRGVDWARFVGMTPMPVMSGF